MVFKISDKGWLSCICSPTSDRWAKHRRNEKERSRFPARSPLREAGGQLALGILSEELQIFDESDVEIEKGERAFDCAWAVSGCRTFFVFVSSSATLVLRSIRVTARLVCLQEYIILAFLSKLVNGWLLAKRNYIEICRN